MTLRSLALTLAVTLTAATAAAQAPASGNTTGSTAASDAPGMQPSKDLQLLGVVIAADYDHVFSSKLKNGPSGKMTINRLDTAVRAWHDWESHHLTFSAAYIYTNYGFSGITPSPFGNVQKVGMSVDYIYDIDEQWGVFTRLAGGFAAETATTLTRGELFSAAIGPSYRWSKDLQFHLGPMFYTRLEDSNSWAFAGDLNWHIDSHWNLNLFAGQTYGGTLSYDIFADRMTTIEGTAYYESNWFRTRNAGTATQAVNETGVVIQVGVTQRFFKAFFVKPYVEALFSRTYQFHVNGNSANSFNVDAGAGVGVQVGAVF